MLSAEYLQEKGPGSKASPHNSSSSQAGFRGQLSIMRLNARGKRIWKSHCQETTLTVCRHSSPQSAPGPSHNPAPSNIEEGLLQATKWVSSSPMQLVSSSSLSYSLSECNSLTLSLFIPDSPSRATPPLWSLHTSTCIPQLEGDFENIHELKGMYRWFLNVYLNKTNIYQ